MKHGIARLFGRKVVLCTVLAAIIALPMAGVYWRATAFGMAQKGHYAGKVQILTHHLIAVGSTIHASVVLDHPADQATTIQITSDRAALAQPMPSSVAIPQGQTSANFDIKTYPAGFDKHRKVIPVTISAQIQSGAPLRAAHIRIYSGVKIGQVSFANASVTSGSPNTGTITIDDAYLPDLPMNINLSISSGSAQGTSISPTNPQWCTQKTTAFTVNTTHLMTGSVTVTGTAQASPTEVVGANSNAHDPFTVN